MLSVDDKDCRVHQELEPGETSLSHDDGGLIAFATLLAIYRIAVDPSQLRHDLGHHSAVVTDDILRLAKRQDGVRAKCVSASVDGLESLPLPALAHGAQGWFLLGRIVEGEALIQRPGSSVEKVSREQLEEIWSGELILGSVDKFASLGLGQITEGVAWRLRCQ